MSYNIDTAETFSIALTAQSAPKQKVPDSFELLEYLGYTTLAETKKCERGKEE